MAEVKFVGKCALISQGAERVLAVGDLHLGFEEALNKSGVLVTRVMYKEMMREFDRVFEEISEKINGKMQKKQGLNENANGEQKEEKTKKIVDKIVLLGDIKHNFGEISGQEWKEILGLIDYLSARCGKIILIKGNHDAVLSPIARKRGIKLKEYWKWKGFCFTHGDENYNAIWGDGIRCIVAGHGHPAITLREGVRREKYKCFLDGKLRGKRVIVLPSFSEWYMGSDALNGEVVLAWEIDFSKFNVYAVGDNGEISDFGKLENLKD